MRDALAERLLAQVMGWAPEDVARERPDLQALATYKYDEYQQFSPGMRFVESLAYWLNQFASAEERQVAYDFIKRRLIFCSTAEFNHLVSIAYPDHIRPVILRKAAKDAGINERLVAQVAASRDFRIRQRQCLFLGLSDGARVDVFRRFNSPELTHEQILQTYEVGGDRVDELLEKLKTDLAAIAGASVPEELQRFRTIVLLDDFSGSGISYLRREEGNGFGGKIAKIYRQLLEEPASRLVDINAAEILLVLYLATEQARAHLLALATELWGGAGVDHSIHVVHSLSDKACVRRGDGSPFETLVESYYDPAIEDSHTSMGGSDVRYGFAACGLPLVLSQNTPNNSLCLLWAQTAAVRALFPRISRHRKEG